MDFSGLSFREMYALIEEKLPAGRIVAPVLLTLLVLWLAALAIPAIFKGLVKPAVDLVGDAIPSLVRTPWSPAAFTFALSAVMIGGLTYLVVWLSRASERRLYERFDANLRPRLDGIFAKLGDGDVRINELERIARQQSGLSFPQIGDDPQALTIHFARYGFGDKWADVTKEVQAKVTNNTVNFRVLNESLNCQGERDPSKGNKKDIEVTYSVGGRLHPPARAREKTQLVIPETPIGKSVGVGAG
jgi:hypothetical protein